MLLEYRLVTRQSRTAEAFRPAYTEHPKSRLNRHCPLHVDRALTRLPGGADRVQPALSERDDFTDIFGITRMNIIPQVSAHGDRKRPAKKKRLVTLKDLLWFVYLYPLRFWSRLLTIEGFKLNIRMVTPFMLPAFRSAERRLLRRMEKCPQLRRSAVIADRLPRRYIGRTIRRAVDDLLMDRIMQNHAIGMVTVDGLAFVDDALARKRGVIVVSGHFFANRLAKQYLKGIGYTVTSVRNRRPRDSQTGRIGERYLKKRYDAFLHHVIGEEIAMRDKNLSLKILACLRNNGIVSIHNDSEYSRRTTEVAFLGTKRQFPEGFLWLAKRSGAAIIPMLCMGDSDNLKIRFDSEIPLAPDNDEKAFVAKNLPLFVRHLENQILEHPDQWETWISL